MLRMSPLTMRYLCGVLGRKGMHAVVASIAVTTTNVHGNTLRQVNVKIGYCLNSRHTTTLTGRGKVAHARTNVHVTTRRRPRTLCMFNGTPATLVRLYSLVQGRGTRPYNVVTTPINFIRIYRDGRVIGPFDRVPGLVMRKHGKKDGLTTALMGTVLAFSSTRRLGPKESMWIRTGVLCGECGQ